MKIANINPKIANNTSNIFFKNKDSVFIIQYFGKFLPEN